MGMGVYGTNPKSKHGEYFRNTVWSWHPLWDYCCAVAPEITRRVRYGHSNDGDGLDERGSKQLAAVLRREILSGRTAAYARARQARLESLPDVPCIDGIRSVV